MAILRNIVGQKYGRLTVVSYFGLRSNRPHWNCVCDCGVSKILAGTSLKTGNTTSCGCFLIENRKGHKVEKIKNRVGEIYGRLRVLSYAGRAGDKNVLTWNCVCDCGKEKIARGGDLQSGSVSSCGCYKIESTKKANTKHMKCNTPEYRAWTSMKSRCSNPNVLNYHNYGGRGIYVCQRWVDSFDNFFEDMGVKPTKKHSLDRIENGLNYEKSNCRWATTKQQLNNVRRNHIVTYNGQSKTLSIWGEELGFRYGTVSERLRRGCSVVDAFEAPSGMLVSDKRKKHAQI